MPEKSKIVAISMGGTKFAGAVVDTLPQPRILHRTRRIEWRRLPAWLANPTLETLMGVVAEEVHGLLEDNEVSPNSVSMIGLGWPGPGRYSTGRLRATFIPGCQATQPVHRILSDALRSRCALSMSSVRIQSTLDVVLRALGESVSPEGAFFRVPGTGIELNVATGIAAAIVENGKPVMSHTELGETYGQWGRYLFLDPARMEWHWKPSPDGSIPKHDPSFVRLTDRCGGPALVRRFVAECQGRLASGAMKNARLGNLLSHFPVDSNQRDVKQENRILTFITEQAQHGDPLATEFALATACEIGGALQCVIRSLNLCVKKIVLAGGVGETLAVPLDGQPDEFLTLLRSQLGEAATVCRSTMSLDAEFLGFAAPCWSV